ncbi:MAG TPA: class I SAM-dependent methyltransferase [Candidatus Angelobacter sp.]|jgi:ubiquinone/menaquinone biosynthesis C-methylase UbiE|nr:class I SAM-dependent methyltransferase [Candidatus Angelobacter sp.]
MTSLRELQRNWESLAQADPLWSICTDPEKRNQRWDATEFFATGRREIELIMEYLRKLEIRLDHSAPALDFGCGVGRLTRALTDDFPECWGVDISPTMIRLAEGFHTDKGKCRFVLNATADLPMFRDGFFGFIYSSIVFQHIGRKYVKNYLLELVRVLKPGGVFVFQIVDHFRASSLEKFRNKLGLRRRMSRLLKKNQDTFRMEMHCIAERHVRSMLNGVKVRIADVQRTNSAEPGFNGNLQYLDHDPELGYISKQYCLVKLSNVATKHDESASA